MLIATSTKELFIQENSWEWQNNKLKKAQILNMISCLDFFLILKR